MYDNVWVWVAESNKKEWRTVATVAVILKPQKRERKMQTLQHGYAAVRCRRYGMVWYGRGLQKYHTIPYHAPVAVIMSGWVLADMVW